MKIYIHRVPGAITAPWPEASLKRTSLVGKIVSASNAEVLTRCDSELQSAEQGLVVDMRITIPGG